LYIYETFYLGDRKTGTITKKDVPYVSRHPPNMRICGMKTELRKKLCAV
jgi:hypothetical protein